MTKKEKLTIKYNKRLQIEIKNDDTEGAHVIADILLCELLKELGYEEVINIYDKIKKWYG